MTDLETVMWDKIGVIGICKYQPSHPENVYNRLIHRKALADAEKYVKPTQYREKALKIDLWNEVVEDDGTTYRYMREWGYRLYFLEKSDILCNFAAQKYFIANINEGDIRDMPFPDNYFSFIVDFSTNDHVVEFHKVVEEYYRCLRPGGILLFFTAIRSWYSKRRGFGMDKFGEVHTAWINVQYYHDLEDVRLALSRFEIIKERYTHSMHNFGFLRKVFKKLPYLIPLWMNLEYRLKWNPFAFQYICIARKI